MPIFAKITENRTKVEFTSTKISYLTGLSKVKMLIKQIKSIYLMAALVAGLMVGSTQQSRAAFYDNYYSLYVIYLNAYNSTGVLQYYYNAIAFYYYYIAGYSGDYYGYYYDPTGFKSTIYRGSTTFAGYYYDHFAFYGDYYIRL